MCLGRQVLLLHMLVEEAFCMCDYCLKHGAGKRCYLNANNYRENCERDKKRENFIREFVGSFKRAYEERLKAITPKPRGGNWLRRKLRNRYGE
jgi:hypothetical protein